MNASLEQLAEPVAQASGTSAAVSKVHDMTVQLIDQLHARMAADPPPTPEEAERMARAGAGLTRTLRETMRHDAPPAPHEPVDDNTIPRDLDELRRELSRRLAALVAEQSAEISGGA
ncbi:MAG: hypothetical protein QOD40_2069 [Alphaproteobacteria bacterium]|jgi:hypothetical protein|nr:hypothetical protein [Alphaproteobacteria bacterium]